MRNWKLPLIILCLLVLAMIFRWSIVSSQTLSSSTVNYKKDNWNGSVYQQRYSTNGYSERLVQPPSDYMWFDSQLLTAAWGIMVTGSSLWLLFTVGKPKKPSNKEQNLID